MRSPIRLQGDNLPFAIQPSEGSGVPAVWRMRGSLGFLQDSKANAWSLRQFGNGRVLPSCGRGRRTEGRVGAGRAAHESRRSQNCCSKSCPKSHSDFTTFFHAFFPPTPSWPRRCPAVTTSLMDSCSVRNESQGPPWTAAVPSCLTFEPSLRTSRVTPSVSRRGL